MNAFDKYLFSKDNVLRRRIDVDSSLFTKLEELSNRYDATVNRLVNIAIVNFIEKENVGIYERNDNETSRAHNFSIRESSYRKLEELKNKYGLSICKLINIAIYMTINE